MADHEFKMDTKIKLTLSIGFAGEEKTDVQELGFLIGANSQDDLDSMSESGIEGSIKEALEEWSYEHIDRGWEVVE